MERGGMVVRDVATLVCAPTVCTPFELTASSLVFAPVVLPSRPLFCLCAGVLFVLVAVIKSAP
jgi:hypothetical protein